MPAMSRMRTGRLSLEAVAKDLARQAREMTGGKEAALTAFRQFLDRDSSLTAELKCDAVLPEGRLWELLQRELDAGGRRQRGMFFTPQPLVEFILRSVQEQLARIDLPGPLHLIDPACGYGGFLIEARRHIPAARYSGFEIDGPTCAVARLLATRGATAIGPDIHQLNPLLSGTALEETILGSRIERLTPVIVGNPPWSNFGRQNRGAWIDGLLEDYRTGLHERKSNLADTAIKFLRWSQYWIEQAGAGILALVTPNTWLAGLTQRQMRESLLNSFDELLVFDLRGESSDVGDENLFGVRSGVAVVLGVLRQSLSTTGSATAVASVRFASLCGSRADKVAALGKHTLRTLARTVLHPIAPDWLLLAQSKVRPAGRRRESTDYASFWPLDRIFREYSSGVQTKNDALFVAFTREELASQVRAWLTQLPEPQSFDETFIRPYLLAPFDRRWIYYDPRVLGRARYAVMRHMLRPNLGLVFMRQSTLAGEYDHFLAVDCLVSDRVFYSRHGAPFLAPLWLEEGGQRSEVGGQKSAVGGQRSEAFRVQGSGRQANFAEDFVEAVAGAVENFPDPIDLFCYLYAVAHWPAYRANYAALLRRGFPQFPLPASREHFLRLSELGGRLVELHVKAICRDLPGASLLPAKNESEAVSGCFRLGGYDVLKRWARPRQARGLSADDERELARLARIGRETRRLVAEIDQVAGDTPRGSPQPPPPGVSTVSTSPG
jgi:predicted helicase